MKREDLLNFLLDSRLDHVAKLSDYDLSELNNHMDLNSAFTKLEDYVEEINIPIEQKNKLSNMIFDFESSIASEFLTFNIKYYKSGFSDAVNLIFDAKEFK